MIVNVNLQETNAPGTLTIFELFVVFFTFSRTLYISKDCEAGSAVYRPYLKRLESQAVFSCYYKGRNFSSVI